MATYMPYFEVCPKCGSSRYEGVDRAGGDSPTTRAEQAHCHNCDKWTTYRFTATLKKLAPKFGYPAQFTEQGLKFVPVYVVRNGRGSRHHIVPDLHGAGYVTRSRASQKDHALTIVYAAYVGYRQVEKKIKRVGALANAKNVYGARITPAAERAQRRWAAPKRKK